MKKSHRLFFSSALKCQLSEWGEAQNLQAFGLAGGKLGAGFYFELVATLEGEPDPSTGWMISEQDFHSLLWKVAGPWDHQYLNENESDFQFKKRQPTTENLAQILFARLDEELTKLSTEVRLELYRLRLTQGRDLWVDNFGPDQSMLVTQRFRLQCVHRHHNSDLSWKENKQLYGKCAAVHGHEYQIEVSLKGRPDEKTGLLVGRQELVDQVRASIIEPYDHTYLNEIIGNTSGEILTEEWSSIMRKVWGDKFAFLVVRETRKNSFMEPGLSEDHALLLL